MPDLFRKPSEKQKSQPHYWATFEPSSTKFHAPILQRIKANLCWEKYVDCCPASKHASHLAVFGINPEQACSLENHNEVQIFLVSH